MLEQKWSSLYASDLEDRKLKYDSIQFHLHSPSEHSIDGKLYDVEMHIFHLIQKKYKTVKNHYAVVAVFFELDERVKDRDTFFSDWDVENKRNFYFDLSGALSR